MTPSAWSPRPADWVPLAPGVRWLLRRPNGVDQRDVASEVAQVMSRVYSGRAALEQLGVDPDLDGGEALDLDTIAAYASVLTAWMTAQRCLEGWEGIEDPETGQALDHTDPENVRAALIQGPPPHGADLLAPFLSWVEQPRRPMVAEGLRLRKRARDWWAGGQARCLACADQGDSCAKGASEAGALCPQRETEPLTPAGQAAWAIATGSHGLWDRSGMDGRITGLKYHAALMAYEARCEEDRSDCDHGAAFEAFRAIETGCLEALVEAAETEGKD